MSKQGKLSLILVIILAVMLLVGILQVTNASFNDPETSTANTLRTINNWYNLVWHWRRPITINNGGGALTNFQVRITGNTQALVNAGHMLASGNDIRFTTSDGMTPVSYWIESGMNTTSTVIWVKIPSIPAGSSTIYIYYGNTSATAASSGDNTFIFFDSFETDLAKWTIINSTKGTVARVASPATNGGYSLQLADTSRGDDYGVYAGFTAQTSCVIEYAARVAQTDDTWEMQVLSSTTIGPRLAFSDDGKLQYRDSGWNDFSPDLDYSANTWYSFKLNNVSTATDTYSFYLDGSLRKSNTPFDHAVSNVNRFEFISTSGTATMYIDLVKVRQYAATEPTISSVGTEE